ncbi:MAG: AI-2E family transporter [Chloroflexi bacterium]|nr:AI-2E family transporter [Chloroflexota bacterium]
MEETRPRWSSRTKLTLSLLLLAFFVYLLSRFAEILAPMILAVILAFVLNPAANLIQERLHLRRGLAVLSVYVFMLAAVVTLPIALAPLLADQFTGLNLDFQRLVFAVEDFLGDEIFFAGQVIHVTTLIEQASVSLQAVMEPIFGQTLTLAVDVISSLVWVIFILIVSFYLVKDGEALRGWFEKLVPPAYRSDYIRLRDDINAIWAAFFRGQLLLALVVSLIFAVVGLALGLRFALAMAVFAGLLEFLPSIGHGIWLVTVALLAFSAGSTWLPLPPWAFALLVIGLHLVYQQFDLNYLIPRIIGRSVHLPPLVVILGIVAGAVLAGVLGVLIAAPTIASARVLGRYIYANLFDMEPFPEIASPELPPPNPLWYRKLFPARKGKKL